MAGRRRRRLQLVSYVVKAFDGKGEKEAREREQRMREVLKVVFCDALSETPMEKGYEGPYDIIMQFGGI